MFVSRFQTLVNVIIKLLYTLTPGSQASMGMLSMSFATAELPTLGLSSLCEPINAFPGPPCAGDRHERTQPCDTPWIMCMPLAQTVDRLIETPPGETPPKLGVACMACVTRVGCTWLVAT
jgi:hypothetical protein